MAVKDLKRYQRVVKAVIAERGPYCEACGVHATHVHQKTPSG